MLKELTDQLVDRQNLSAYEVERAVDELVEADVPAELKARFLTCLADKGETIEEIGQFVTQLQQRSLKPSLDRATRSTEILDVCGTGGDRLNTFNISTTVALVAAASGVTVAKHGNRAITSASGSADVLEALGIRIDLPPEEASNWLRDHQFAFFFAPQYHPAFRHIAPARKLCAEKGQRTLFNFLGPLLNPAAPSAQLLGVARPHLCEPLAKVLQSIGVRRSMVVCGEVESSYLDELSTLGKSTVAEFYQDRAFFQSELHPSDLPIQPATLNDLLGGDRFENAAIIRRLLEGKDKGPKRDAVLLNAGAGLFLAGKAQSISEGWFLATEVIESGRGLLKLNELAEASRSSVGG